MIPLLAQTTETTGALRFLAAPEAWVFVLVILPAAAAGVWWVYRREAGRTTPRARLGLGVIRLAILLTVIAILFHPVLLLGTDRVVKQKLILLVDDSSSMQELDSYSNAPQRERLAAAAGLGDPEETRALTRGDLVRRVLSSGKPSLMERLGKRFDTRIYAFDAGLRRDVALDDLAARGTATRMGEALSRVYTELVGQPTAAVALISDGRSNEGVDPARTISRLIEMQQIQIPIITAAVGDPTRRKNLEVRLIKPTPGQDFLVGDQVPFNVELRARGFGEGRLPVRIVIQDEEGRERAAESSAVEGNGGSRKEVLYVQADRVGRRTFTVSVAPIEGEADITDNKRDVVLNIIKKRIKVLYVEGYPRWDYRYLMWALTRDDENFAVHVLLTSAERDFIQECSPDLDPIYTFPTEPAKLFEYDVIILGDVEPSRLADNPEARDTLMKTLRRFVSEAGGGLLMIAGEGSNPHAYAGTPLESALPIVPGKRTDDGLDFQRAFRPERTAAGREDPILRFSKDPEVNERLWEDPEDGLPPLFWFASVKRAKPGARVLLAHPDRTNRFGRLPLLASQFYGKGRTMFLGLDSLWRWRKYHGDRFFYQFYSQALRYLATTKLYRGNKRYNLFTDKRRYDVGESVRIGAGVRNQDFLPADNPTQTVYWQGPGAPRPEKIVLQKVRKGEYEAVILAARRGRHALWIKEHPEAEDRADEYTFEVDITPLEKAEPAMDAGTLLAVAKAAGDLGAYRLLHDLPPALDALSAEPVRFPEKSETRDLWDRWWVLVLLTGLLALEWILRKRYRLQ